MADTVSSSPNSSTTQTPTSTPTPTPTSFTPNQALDLMGKYLDLANKRGAFNLLEAEQIVKAISVFRVPAPTATTPASTPTTTTTDNEKVNVSI